MFGYMLRGFGLARVLRAPEDNGFDVDDDEPDDDLELDDELDEDEELDLDDDPDPDDADDEPLAPPSRGEARQARLAKEAKELRAENERLTREVQARQAAPSAPAQPQETQDQFNARLAQMDPLDRVSYLAELQARNTNAQIANLQFTLQDQTDKLTFDTFCGSNAQARKMAGEVDKRLQDYRKGGVNIPRMDVLKHILGERALENLGRSRTKAERQAEARRDQQRSRPSSGRGDTARESRESGGSRAARDKRVENMKI